MAKAFIPVMVEVQVPDGFDISQLTMHLDGDLLASRISCDDGKMVSGRDDLWVEGYEVGEPVAIRPLFA